MSKPIYLPVGLAVVMSTALCLQSRGQDISKPLSESELTSRLDSLGIGDPVTRQPLGLGDERTFKKTEVKAEGGDDKAGKKEKSTTTEITALEATFDNKTHKAVFIGEVIVKNPEFNVVCDKLTAFLHHEDKTVVEPADPKAPAAAKPVKAPAPAPAKPEKSAKGGGLEKAIAEMNGEGRVLITQEKVESDGTVSRNVGHARKAVYDAATGDITLTGSPSVQQGFNTCIATEERTVMILNREGRMRVDGPHKTVIKDTSAEKPEKNASNRAN